MLQGGTGTGRASSSNVREFVRPLAQALAPLGIETWLVVELFTQRRGPPLDNGAFAADPAEFRRVNEDLLSDEPLVRARIGFAVLDYMDGRSERSARLRREYAAFCRRQALAVRTAPR
jgi:hypothetical protein